MNDGIHYSQGFVHEKGYSTLHSDRIYEGSFKADPLEPATVLLANQGEYGHRYSPLTKPAIYREFAELSGEQEIVEFANQYGFLRGGNLTVCIPIRKGDSPWIVTNDNHQMVPCELISEWLSCVQQIKRTVAVWDSVQRKDTAWLAKRILWKGDRDNPASNIQVTYEDDAGSTLITSSKDKGMTFQQIRYGDLELPARLYLQRAINAALKENVTNMLLFKDDWSGQHNVVVPKDLLSAMWLQLALAIEGNHKYRKCAVCKKPFQVGVSERGKPKTFCSDACRSKDYRQKKKAAAKQ